MLGYRLYVLNAESRIQRAIEMLCEDDEAAISAAKSHWDGKPLELWERQRVVKSFPADPHDA